MIDHLVDALNKDHLNFSIADLYEENDTDYLLLIVEKEVAIVVEAVYNGKTVYFSRLPQVKRDRITSVFAKRIKENALKDIQAQAQ